MIMDPLTLMWRADGRLFIACFGDGRKIGWEELEATIPAPPSGARLTAALRARNRLGDDGGKQNVGSIHNPRPDEEAESFWLQAAREQAFNNR
jgi:hypothetical protein